MRLCCPLNDTQGFGPAAEEAVVALAALAAVAAAEPARAVAELVREVELMFEASFLTCSRAQILNLQSEDFSTTRYGLLPSFLYDLGKPTGGGKSSVNEVIHTAREAVSVRESS